MMPNMESSKKTDKKITNQAQQLRHTQIQNYYGAHKNFKTDFRNKKYKNVYTQLIHRKPSQEEHMALYYQDVLISIIKTLQVSFLGKQLHIGPIQPFFHFGTKAIKQFYWLFLMQKRIINEEVEIDPTMNSKISNFLTLIIDFCCKIGQYMGQNGNGVNSQKIYEICYTNIVQCVISSSTSNVLLLKKCGQFLLQYSKHCLKTSQDEKAHQLIKDGMRTQLNQLMLLKYKSKERGKQKKCLKRYLSTLKALNHFYLNLALYYQKTDKAYECATVILDAVLTEQLICSYQNKFKKWICNLEQSYAEEKNKYVEVKRICDHFFEDDYLKQLKIRNSISAQSQVTVTNYQSINKRTSNQDESKNSFYIFFGDQIQLKGQMEKQQDHRQNSQIDKKKDKKSKEVRFKMTEDDGIEMQMRAPINRLEELRKINEQKQLFERGRQDIGTVYKTRNENKISKEQDALTKLQQLKTIRKQSKGKSLLGNNIQNRESNDFLFFGDNFWEPVPIHRSKSLMQRVKNNSKYEQRKLRKNDSFNSDTFLEADAGKYKINAHHTRSKTFLKQNFVESDLKKKASNKKGFFHMSQQKPDNFETVGKKFHELHKKYHRVQMDLTLKIERLKQRKNMKNGQQTVHFAQCLSSQSPEMPENKSKIQKAKAQITQDPGIKKFRKQSGINIFKQFLIDNKNFFGITKTQLFSHKPDIQGQKRYLSFLVAQKPEKIEKFVQKNHWQAKNNVLHFIKEIQDSNKKLKKNKAKQPSLVYKIKGDKKPGRGQFFQDEKLLNMDRKPSNLFGTSLRQRAKQASEMWFAHQ